MLLTNYNMLWIYTDYLYSSENVLFHTGWCTTYMTVYSDSLERGRNRAASQGKFESNHHWSTLFAASFPSWFPGEAIRGRLMASMTVCCQATLQLLDLSVQLFYLLQTLFINFINL